MPLENALADFVEILFSQGNADQLLDKGALLPIHHDHYFLTLTHTLKTHYPMTMALLGEDCFETFCCLYISDYPSTDPELEKYGAYFPAFLSKQETLNHVPYVIDIATVEWICHTLPMLEPSTFSFNQVLSHLDEQDYDKLYIELNPSAQLFASPYPLLRLITYCKSPTDQPFEMTQEPCQLLLIKTKEGVSFFALDDAEYTFLEALIEESPLKQALSHALAKDADFPCEETLMHFIQSNIVRNITINN